MSVLNEILGDFDAARLAGMKRGIEKESLRAAADGRLAGTPHSIALGAALTHPHITTDFSESQVELITGVHDSAQGCIDELTGLHQEVYRAIGDERLWVSSMPCRLPAEAEIPIGQYGLSNVGRLKTVYRQGLSQRYGRRMQTISGIHYNWSLPGLGTDDYFGLIRNFRRQAFVLLYLYGASPALDSHFVDGMDHGLQPLGADTLYLPHATSLRMGRLGYQSEAQSALCVSYNGLDSYGHSLHAALTQPYPPYVAMGVRDEHGAYRQLSTSVLQIENEFYGSIRPKRTIRSGERPLHALRERGVEYVEVRCMDLDPFEDVGIQTETGRFIDVFLLHCLLNDSPSDTPEEIAALGRNQHLTAARGREPGLRLERGQTSVLLTDWVAEILEACAPIARRLDEVHGGDEHARAVSAAQAALLNPATLPSARVLDATSHDHGGSFVAFVQACSERSRDHLRALPVAPAQAAQWARRAADSLAQQAAIEAAETQSFEDFLVDYLAPERLG